MSRRESEPIQRFHINLFTSDIEWLRERYGRDNSLGIAKAVRKMVRMSIKKIEEREAEKRAGRQVLTIPPGILDDEEENGDE